MPRSASHSKPSAAQHRVTVASRLGLHARPAALFVQTANRFASHISVFKGKVKVNGKSIMGIMMLAAAQGESLLIHAEGPDAAQAVERLVQLVEKEILE